MLSLCMIVKDAEDCLAACLSSVASLVDEMVIVDTGSTDATPNIAERFGARVFHHPLNGDYAAARNFSLGRARGDQVLVMDADEVLPADSAARLRHLLSGGREAAAYRFFRYELIGSGWDDGWTPPRLIPRRADVHYVHALFEDTTPSLVTAGVAVVEADVILHHRAHAGLEEQLRAKQRRYCAMLDARLADPATEHDPERCFLYRFKRAQLAADLGAWDEAFARIDEAIPMNPMALFFRGDFHRGRAEFVDAVACYEQVRDVAARHGPTLWLAEADNRLGLAHRGLGRDGRAVEAYRRALTVARDNARARYLANLGRAHEVAGRTDDARQAFAGALRFYPDLPRTVSAAEQGRMAVHAHRLTADPTLPESRPDLWTACPDPESTRP